MRKKFLNDHRFRAPLTTTSSLIEFSDEKISTLLLNKFGSAKISILKEIKDRLTDLCIESGNSVLFKGKSLKIQRAPEPSDILWENCEKKYSICRKLLIYFTTFLIILISFGVITGLEFVQIRYNERDDAEEDDNVARVLNILVVVALQAVNQILWVVLFYLLDLEYNHTLT